MNLTINHSHQNTPHTNTHNQEEQKMEVQIQKESPRDAERQCSTFFYSCMAGKRSSPRQGGVIPQQRHSRVLMEPHSPPMSSLLQNSQGLPRRRKISLSLNLKHSRHRTPSKDEASSHHRPASQHKKFKTEQGTPQQQPIKAPKLKTQPKKQYQGKEYIHQLKQSRKPSTQIGSAHSAKKSNESSNKMKLTLSNAFKSQMNQAQQVPPFVVPLQEPPPSSLMIEDSFMTARLANIYASSQLELFPNSNIVYYNQIMANDWRGKEKKRQRPKGEISIQDIQEMPAQDPPSDANIKSKFKQRKWIGDYAKTIKTFNQSELRSNELNSDAQSIVLEKGCSQFNAFVPVSHGSSKQCNQQPKSKEIMRPRKGYGSVGEQYGAFSATNQSKFKKMTSPPIVEVLYDSEHYE